jgi:hypothetical protein
MSEGVIVVRQKDLAGGVFESLDHVMKHALDVAQTRWDIDTERERWKQVPHRVATVQAILRHLSLMVMTDPGEGDGHPPEVA